MSEPMLLADVDLSCKSSSTYLLTINMVLISILIVRSEQTEHLSPPSTRETELPEHSEQPEHLSTCARAALGGGLRFGAQNAQNAHELT